MNNAMVYEMHQVATMTTPDTHIRWEIWIGETAHDPEFPELRWRFNACFDERSKAEAEGAWVSGARILECGHPLPDLTVPGTPSRHHWLVA